MKILMRAPQDIFGNFNAFDTIVDDKIWSNVGNLIFPYSIYKNLVSEDVEIDTYSNIKVSDAKFINEHYDVFLIPLANAFRASFVNNLKILTQLVENLKIPCVVVGVGVQCEINDTSNATKGFSFDETVIRFLKAVADKSVYIGVRGQATYDYLSYLGFRDQTRIIGCPSMYMYGGGITLQR